PLRMPSDVRDGDVRISRRGTCPGVTPRAAATGRESPPTTSAPCLQTSAAPVATTLLSSRWPWRSGCGSALRGARDGVAYGAGAGSTIWRTAPDRSSRSEPDPRNRLTRGHKLLVYVQNSCSDRGG